MVVRAPCASISSFDSSLSVAKIMVDANRISTHIINDDGDNVPCDTPAKAARELLTTRRT